MSIAGGPPVGMSGNRWNLSGNPSMEHENLNLQKEPTLYNSIMKALRELNIGANLKIKLLILGLSNCYNLNF